MATYAVPRSPQAAEISGTRPASDEHLRPDAHIDESAVRQREIRVFPWKAAQFRRRADNQERWLRDMPDDVPEPPDDVPEPPDDVPEPAAAAVLLPSQRAWRQAREDSLAEVAAWRRDADELDAKLAVRLDDERYEAARAEHGPCLHERAERVAWLEREQRQEDERHRDILKRLGEATTDATDAVASELRDAGRPREAESIDQRGVQVREFTDELVRVCEAEPAKSEQADEALWCFVRGTVDRELGAVKRWAGLGLHLPIMPKPRADESHLARELRERNERAIRELCERRERLIRERRAFTEERDTASSATARKRGASPHRTSRAPRPRVVTRSRGSSRGGDSGDGGGSDGGGDGPAGPPPERRCEADRPSDALSRLRTRRRGGRLTHVSTPLADLLGQLARRVQQALYGELAAYVGRPR